MPVVYAPEGRGRFFEFFFPPARLTPEQAAAVIDAAERAVPGGVPWFVEVWDQETDWLTGRSVYRVCFEPEDTAPRMRKGRCCVVTGPPAGGAPGDVGDVRVHAYVQVSEPGTTFGAKLEAPAVASLPFPLPLNGDKSPAFSDVELLEIADLARAHEGREKLPIGGIADRDGAVTVYFRSSEAGGPFVRLSRANGAFSYAGFGVVRR